jgi:hypothetical protein
VATAKCRSDGNSLHTLDSNQVMKASDVEVGDIVMVHGIKTGKVVHKFLSQTGEEVYDIKLAYGPFRVAALEDDIVVNYGPRDDRFTRW